MLVLESLVVFHRTVQLSLFSITGMDLDYCDIGWFALEMNRDYFVILRLNPSTAVWTLLLTMMATPFLLKDSYPQ